MTENLEISRVAFRAPPFWDANPELWFAQIESQFKLSGIVTDETKFHSVIAALDMKALSYISDLIHNPPTSDLYNSIKTRLLNYFSQSESSKIRILLQELQLGDKRPSQLLLEMKNLANKHFTDDVLKTMWLQRLSPETQQILSACNETLDGLAKIADKINEVSSRAAVNAFSQENLSLQSLKDEISNLSAEVKRLSRAKFRNENNRNRRRSFSRGKINKNSENKHFCWYHQRFAQKAHKCIKPCSFQENQ